MRTTIILFITLCSTSLISAQLPNWFQSHSNGFPSFPNFPNSNSAFQAQPSSSFSQFQPYSNRIPSIPQPQPSNSFSQFQPYNNRIPSVPQPSSSFPGIPQPPQSTFTNYQQFPSSAAQPQTTQAGPQLSLSWNINHAVNGPQPQRQFQGFPTPNYASQPQAFSSPSIPQPPSSPSFPQSFSSPSIPQSFNTQSLQQYRPPQPQQLSAPSIPQYQPQPAPQQSFQSTNQITSPQNSQNFNPAPVHYASIGPQLQGDYKFGYHTGDGGSFREETRLPDGTVQGAYGFIDANGKQRIVKYTAGKEGFKAEGDDVPRAAPVAPLAAPLAAPSAAPLAAPSIAPRSNSLGTFSLEDSPAFKSFMSG